MPNQVDLAVYYTAHAAPGGLSALAQKMGLKPQNLRNKVNPNEDAHRLSLKEALAMMRLTEDVSLLEAMAAELGYRVEGQAPAAAESVTAALVACVAENGDVGRALEAALADRRITPRELAAIRHEIAEARNALDVLEQTLMQEAAL